MELDLCSCRDEDWGDAFRSASGGESGVLEGDAGIKREGWIEAECWNGDSSVLYLLI